MRDLIFSSLNTALSVVTVLPVFFHLKLNIKEKLFFSSSYLYVYVEEEKNHFSLIFSF